MTKEIYISSTPHETRLAVVENDKLAEIYYERENEYTLAGSIYKGKVTRVLPGMQSAFVDIGLERDAFLYVTDFAEEQEDGEEYVSLAPGQSRGKGRSNGEHANGAHRSESHVGGEDSTAHSSSEQRKPAHEGSDTPDSPQAGDESGAGGRRWRGRRGRRRGRGGSPGQVRSASDVADESTPSDAPEAMEFEVEPVSQGADFSEAQEQGVAEPTSERISEPSARPRSEHPRSEHSRSEQVPFVLPGESLSKYRRGEAPQASIASPKRETVAATQSAFHPSTMVEGPLAWDGSDVLPGESISRHKHQPAFSSSTPEAFSSPAAEVSPVADETASEQVGSETLIGAAEETNRHEVAHVGSDAETKEFEPSEASASYRVDPSTTSAYRQSNVVEPPVAEPLAAEPAPSMEPEPEPTQGFSAPEQEQSNGVESSFDSSLAGPGAMVEPEDPRSEEAAAFAETEPFAEMEADVPVQTNDHAFIGEDFAAHLEEDALDEHAESDRDEHIFDPGHGNLEEEMIDEEEPETYVVQSLGEETGFDDLIEETLDVQMDSGLLSELVRDQHLDKRTRSNENEDGEEESGDESSVEDPFGNGAFTSELGDIELEDDLEDANEDTESPNADAARPSSGGSRNQRRGNRGQQRQGSRGGNNRMRRATAQTTNLPAITELLKPNQEILVQIAKEPIARKGARITSHIALPGRFLVFMPTVNHVGVSRKISSDEERQRLKHILLSEKGTASGGFIVRTAAASASEEDLRADIRFLLTLWAEIRQRTENAKPPALIYHDLSLVERVLRDQVTDNFSAIWVDSESDYERVLRFLNRFEPALVRRVKLYTKETPLFEQFGIQEEINNALHSKVWLKSGGSIVINQTEALVAIDINTGKYVGKTARLEDTIVKTNLDAIPEIVRQIRLRDLGGIIVIDFIDMDERKNRNRVMAALEDELKSDRAPSKVLQFNDFGLVAITRKRVKQSLERTLSVPCSVCSGTGMVKGPLTVCNEIYVELRKMCRQIDRGDVLLRVNPEVVKQLKSSNGRWLSEMEEMSGKTVIVKSDASLHPEQFDIQ
ncbi:MAG: Rne/Rng family ribonuclease [Acidobacteriaceae bacterium]